MDRDTAERVECRGWEIQQIGWRIGIGKIKFTGWKTEIEIKRISWMEHTKGKVQNTGQR